MVIKFDKFKEMNNEIDKLNDEKIFVRDLKDLVVAIIEGKGEFITESDKLINELNIKTKKQERWGVSKDKIYGWYGYNTKYCCYIIKLNKTNIKKVEDYINGENNE